MIYLSQLALDPTSRQVRSELADPYQMHRTLSRAFGDADGELAQARPLFRVVEGRDREMQVLVQSRLAPDWDRLPRRGSYLAEPPEVKALDLSFRIAQRLRFHLRANPTERRVFGDPAPGQKPSGKRVGIYGEQAQRTWLDRKAAEKGFRVLSCVISDRGFQTSRKSPNGPVMRHLCVDFDGILEVTDPKLFLDALQSGIGSAKGFGFGLLSVARA